MAAAALPRSGTGTRDRLAVLEAVLTGQVIRPGDATYDEARQVHNASYDRRPMAIVKVADAADVAATVQFARSQPGGPRDR